MAKDGKRDGPAPGMAPLPPVTPLEDARQSAVMVFSLLIPLLCALATLVCIFTRELWLFFAVYLIVFFFDKRHVDGRGQPSSFVRHWGIWKNTRNYFNARLVKTTDLDPTRNYFFIGHPHGIFSFSMFINILSEANRFSQVFPGIDRRILGAPAMFWVPFLRDIMLGMGVVNASSESAEKVLENGLSLFVLPGGTAEALVSEPKTNKLILNRRKGFIRLALQKHTPLVPVFHFGETNAFEQVRHPLLMSLQKKMEKLTTFTVPLFYGRGGLPLPKRCTITTVVGAPIEVPRILHPTQKEIDHWHGVYKEALQRLYDEYKEQNMRDRRESLLMVE